MSTSRASVYLYQLRFNKTITERQLEGLSDADLLLQPASRGNCANWILGHIITSRQIALQYLSDDFVWDEEKSKLYSGGSAPITGEDSPHLKRDELMDAYNKSYDQLIDCIEQLTDADLAKEVTEDRTLEDRVNFAIWHEAYHTGQFEYLRQLTGVDDSVP